MFYFEELLSQGLAGIDRTAMISTVIGIAYAILLVGFLIGIYQAALRGGDLQSLATTAIKYLAIAIILANWSSAFREVNTSFNQIAHYIDNASGIGDMFLSWWDQLKQQFSTNGFSAILPAISGGWAAISAALAVVVAYLIYAIAFVIFAFFYVLYGCVLYVVGPLVLSLLPTPGVGQLAKSYASNLMIWNAWGVLYAIFGSLITAIQFNHVNDVMNQGFLTGFFKGGSQTTILGMISIFYALALALIPLIAKRVITGDVGSTVLALVKAAAVAASAALSVGMGLAGAGEGASAGAGSGGASSGTGAAAGSAGGGTASTSSVAPPQPSVANTIRSAMQGLFGGDAPSSPPSESSTPERSSSPGSSGGVGSGSKGGGSGNGSRSGASRATGFKSPVAMYGSLTNAAAFHVGRFAGQAARSFTSRNGGNGNDNHEEKK